MTIDSLHEDLIRAVVEYGEAYSRASREPIKLHGRVTAAYNLHISDDIDISTRPDGSVYASPRPFIAVAVETDDERDPEAYMVYRVTLQTAIAVLSSVKRVEF